MMSALSKFVGFCPFPAAIENFEEELKGFDCGKGSVKLPNNRPIPQELIIKTVQFRKQEILHHVLFPSNLNS